MSYLSLRIAAREEKTSLMQLQEPRARRGDPRKGGRRTHTLGPNYYSEGNKTVRPPPLERAIRPQRGQKQHSIYFERKFYYENQ